MLRPREIVSDKVEGGSQINFDSDYQHILYTPPTPLPTYVGQESSILYLISSAFLLIFQLPTTK